MIVRKLAIFIVAGIACIILGSVSANLTGVWFRYEEFRMDENSTVACPEQYDKSDCKKVANFNPHASGGFEGYPLVTGKYYCVDDQDCYTVTQTNLIGSLKIRTANQILFSVFYFLLFLSYVWIRTRMRRNIVQSSTESSEEQ